MSEHDERILAALPYAYAVANRTIKARRPEDREDLRAEGIVGLVQAARTWRSEGDVPFVYYAARRVKGAILDSLREIDPLTRADRHRLRAGDTTVSVPVVISLERLADVGYPFGPERATPRPALVRAVAKLPPTQRRVIAMTFGRGMTLRETGNVLGLSESGVCRVRQKALIRLRSAIEREMEEA